VLTVSDGVVAGTREDASGDLLGELLLAEGFEVTRRVVAHLTEAIAGANLELGGEARVERHAGRREQDRHHARERERHAQANRQLCHGVADATAHRPR
jgi:hypothetical protein